MKSPLPPFLERIQAETLARREALAGELLGLDAIRGAIVAAAGKGLAVACVRPPYPVDLRETEAARAAVKHLRDSGLHPGWEAYVAEMDGRPTTGWELQVTWERDARPRREETVERRGEMKE